MSNTNIFNWWYNRVLVKQEPFTVQALKVTPLGASTTFYIYNAGGNNPNLEYSYDGFTWIAAPTSSENAVTFREAFYLRGDNSDGISSSSSKYTTIMFTYGVKIEGDIRHLIEGSGIPEGTEVPCDYCFFRLFASIDTSNKCHVSDAFSMTMPYTTLKTSCYQAMFTGSTIITSMATLPASTLVSNCYDSMFYGCTSLTYSPTLPATTLASSCYSQMFYGCTSLTQVPVLSSTNLAAGCYAYMYQNCTSLTTPPSLPATTLSDNCYQGMFMGCTHLVSSPSLSAAALTTRCYNAMFSGCTSLSTCGTLGWSSVSDHSCYGMFTSCTSLRTSPVIPLVFTLASNCYANMFNGCTNLNKVTASIAEWQSGGSYIYTSNWLAGVASTGTFDFNYKGSAPASRGVHSVPTNWTIVNEGSLYAGLSVKFSNQSTFSIGNFVNTTTGEPRVNLEYSTDLVTWTPWPYSSTSSTAAMVVSAGWYFFRGDNPNGWTTNQNTPIATTYGPSVSSVMGNVMSLIDLNFDDPEQRMTEIPCNFCFYRLFANWMNPTYMAVELPATTLKDYCYGSMFQNSNISRAPDLPATTLVPWCYNSMFYGCSSLRTLPNVSTSHPNGVLPAGTLAEHCYDQMFYHCTYLGSVPSDFLPATTLTEGCYKQMFDGCTHITSVPSLPATTLAYMCCHSMFYGCSSLITVPSDLLPVTTLASSCYYQMFQGCTSLTSAPSLPAISLAQQCYTLMFQGCTSLTSAPSLPATILASSCYTSMFNYCTSLTSAPSLPATTLAPLCYQSMFKSCTSLTTPPSLPATTLANQCYSYMFSSCTFTTPPSLPATTLSDKCYEYMFEKCYSLTTPPSLPATTLAPNCYQFMFQGCTSLTSVPSDFLPVTTLATYCYAGMFRECYSLATAPSLPATTLPSYCYDGMFYGCATLTSAPSLPATTLDAGCYRQMFLGCISLEGPINISYSTLPSTYCAQMFMRSGISRASGTSDVINVGGSRSWWTDYSNAGVDTSVWRVLGPDYLTITPAASSKTIYLENHGTNNPNCEYSLDNGVTWSALPTSSGSALSFSTNIFLRGTNPNGFSTSGTNYSILKISSGAQIWGDITSLINGSGNVLDLTGKDYCFYRLFDGYSTPSTNTTNISIRNIGIKSLLPSTVLSDHCYAYMFRNCGNMYTIPYLPALTLTTSCYYYMFSGSWFNREDGQSVLPATTLATSCYVGMFNNSIGLCRGVSINATTAPSSSSVSGMFTGSGTSRSIINMGYITVAANGSDWSSYAGIDTTYWTVQDDSAWTGLKFIGGGTYQSCDVTINKSGTISDWTLEISEDMGTTWTSYSFGTFKSLLVGKIICFRGQKGSNDLSGSNYIRVSYSTSGVNVYGDLTSLLNGTGGVLDLTPYGAFTFYQMFDNFRSFTAPTLPSSTLTHHCYTNMFQSCTNLKVTPAIPATTIPNSACANMFQGCTSLTTISQFSPTSIGSYGCQSMFKGCQYLNSSVAFSATVGARGCSYMFQNCSLLFSISGSLTPTDSYACEYMFDMCSSLTSVPSGFLPSTTIYGYCYQFMFQGCTSLKTVPVDLLPALTVYTNSYQYMFSQCSLLTAVPNLPATTIAQGSYKYMFYNCFMLSTVPVISTTNITYDGLSYMFINCVSIRSVPEGTLTISSLSSYGLNYMFSGCLLLNEVHITFNNNVFMNGNNSFNWLNGVASTGTIYATTNPNWTLNSPSGVPVGWTLVNL